MKVYRMEHCIQAGLGDGSDRDFKRGEEMKVRSKGSQKKETHPLVSVGFPWDRWEGLLVCSGPSDCKV